jgi:hypothetical protein
VSQGRASRQVRIPLETTRSSGPAHSAGPALTLTTAPDRRCVSLGDQRLARHGRRDERCQDVEDSDHPPPRLEHRNNARDHTVLLRVLARSPRAEASALPREERPLPPPPHVRTIVAWRDLDAPASVARALDDAVVSAALASADRANLLEHRARCTPEASALPLPRREDRLEVRLAPPDLRMSQAPL